jgi:hypothetical protein
LPCSKISLPPFETMKRVAKKRIVNEFQSLEHPNRQISYERSTIFFDIWTLFVVL